MEAGDLSDWVGRTHHCEDLIALAPARAMAATLGGAAHLTPEIGSPLPYPWLWAYFLEPADKSQIGPDGHPRRGGFLPPIPNPRRMWAGSRCWFDAPLQVGESAQKTSTIEAIQQKDGRAGPMVFVTVTHVVRSGGREVMREEQDIVYMDIPDVFRAPDGKPVPSCAHVEAVDVDPVFLFRYSALTFNGHRIHYDRTYAREVEKYPGLVVHGPLQATLLYDLATRTFPDRVPARFEFRGVRPLFDFDEVSLHAREADANRLELFTSNGEGAISMTATLEWVQ